MEEAVSRRKSGCARKRTRKRPYTRKACLSSTFIDMAEARREIYNALQLHRSSSSRSPAVPCSSSSHHQQQSSSPPLPEPTCEVLEVEWFDHVSSSCAWWMAFLTSLDRKTAADQSPERSPQ